MQRKIIQIAGLIAIVSMMGCRQMMFWRPAAILGEARIQAESVERDESVRRQRPASSENRAISLNFIHHEGTLDNTIISVQTDPLGRYRSPKLVPGMYTVEAMLPGYVVEEATIELRSHEHKRVNFTLYLIGEAEGRSMAEAEDDNIRAPGQVQIGRPKH